MNVPKRGLAGLVILGGVVAGLGACATPHDGAHGVPTGVHGPQAASPGHQTVLQAKVSGDRPTGDPSAYSAVRVRVANLSTTQLDVNPFDFAVTDQDGTKHVSYVTGDAAELRAVTLKPGENVKGVVYFKGGFVPKKVTLLDPLGGPKADAKVAGK